MFLFCTCFTLFWMADFEIKNVEDPIKITKNDVYLFAIVNHRYLLHSISLGKCQNLPEILESSDCQNVDHLHKFERGVLEYDLECCWEAVQPKPENQTPAKRLKELKEFLSLDTYLNLMSRSLKSALKKISTYERLAWIVNLLIHYHGGDECSIFMGCAIKLCLKAFHLRCCRIRDFTIYVKRLQQYLKIIQKNKCRPEILSQALKVLLPSQEFKHFFFRDTENLKYVIENVSKNDLKLCDVLMKPKFPLEIMNFLDVLLFENFKRFALIVEFGIYSNYSVMEKEFRRRNKKTASCAYYSQLRSMQTIALFRNKHLLKKEYALKLLWSAIPDPYLTFEEMRTAVKSLTEKPKFKNCFQLDFHYRKMCTISEKEMAQVWMWYEEMLCGRETVKSPRNLQHLSRCAIRHRLSMNFRMPHAIYSFEIPKVLKNYLLLKDCGETASRLRSDVKSLKKSSL